MLTRLMVYRGIGCMEFELPARKRSVKSMFICVEGLAATCDDVPTPVDLPFGNRLCTCIV